MINNVFETILFWKFQTILIYKVNEKADNYKQNKNKALILIIKFKKYNN